MKKAAPQAPPGLHPFDLDAMCIMAKSRVKDAVNALADYHQRAFTAQVKMARLIAGCTRTSLPGGQRVF